MKEEKVLSLIEILNTLARGEEMPEYIEYDECAYVWEPNENDYRMVGDGEYLFTNLFQTSSYDLNAKVYVNRKFDYSDIENNIEDLKMIWNRVSIKDSKEIQNTIQILKQYLVDIEKWEG
jgi:hypothetical protein